jgi:hypothetical protein
MDTRFDARRDKLQVGFGGRQQQRETGPMGDKIDTAICLAAVRLKALRQPGKVLWQRQGLGVGCCGNNKQ